MDKKRLGIMLLILSSVIINISFVLGGLDLGFNGDEGVPTVLIEVPTSTNTTSDINVNSSEIWVTNVGNLDDVNSTQFDGGDGTTLNIKESWLSTIISLLGGGSKWIISSVVPTSNYLYNDSDTLYFNETTLNATIDKKTQTTFYNASSVENITGITQGSLLDIQSYNNIPFNISEVASDFELRINFTNIEDFNELIIRYKSTQEDENHLPLVQIYDYDEDLWEDYGGLPTIPSYSIVEFGVFDSSSHIDIHGTVQVRIYQDEGPPPKTHLHNFDWVIISKGLGTPTGQEVDPFAIHKDGTTMWEGNELGNYYNSTGWDYITARNWSNVTGLTNLLYAPINYGDDWNKTYADTLYAPNTTAGIQYLINHTNLNLSNLETKKLFFDLVYGNDGTQIFDYNDGLGILDIYLDIETLGNNINAGVGTVTASTITDTTASLSSGKLSALTGGLTTDADNAKLIMGTSSDGEIYVDANDDLIISDVTQDKDILLKVNDGGVTKTLIKLDGDTGNVDMTGAGLVYVNDLDVDSPSAVYGLSHNSFADYVANEHIDWTSATDNLLTTGNGTFAKLAVGTDIQGTFGTSLTSDSFSSTASIGALNINMIYGTDLATNSNQIFYGARLNAQTASTYTGNHTGTAIGFSNVANHYGSGTVTRMYGTSAQVVARDGSGAMTNARTFYVFSPLAQGTGSITNAVGMWMEEIAGGTNNKGIILDGDNDGGSIWFGRAQDSYINWDGTNLLINTTAVSNGDAYFTRNVSATGYITRTTVYDKSRGSALDKILDADDLITDGVIDHSKFYGYVEQQVSDKSRPELEEVCYDLDGEEVCQDEVIYPHTKIEEGVSLDSEIELLRQAIYELKIENQNLKTRIGVLEKG